jgi:hypothetical protein
VTWTYDQTLASDLAKVRFEIQDTETSDQLFSDEEIGAVLTAQGSVRAATLYLARRLMMRFARLVDTTVGRVSESASQRYAAYKEIVANIEAEQASLCLPSFGGTTVSANEALDANTDLVQPETKIGGTDNTRDVSTFGGGGG